MIVLLGNHSIKLAKPVMWTLILRLLQSDENRFDSLNDLSVKPGKLKLTSEIIKILVISCHS